MKKVGFIGYRGMVGSVLMERMAQENDFSRMESHFFSTSTPGAKAPEVSNGNPILLDAMDLKSLQGMDILLSTQGGDYTNKIYPGLRENGWKGIWIDAASALRMHNETFIVLDPINGTGLQDALHKGIRTFVGGNCTVSLLLIALHGLFKEDLVEWVSTMTYQAASGAGAKNMIELLQQMSFLGNEFSRDPGRGALDLERQTNLLMGHSDFPKDHFGHPLALSLLPWIDSELESGQSKEEWKAQVEANKILQRNDIIPIDGTCVRVSSLRCHSQGLLVKLKKNISVPSVEDLLREANPWVKVIQNTKTESLKELTPFSVSGKMHIPIGRLRKTTLGENYLNAFTLGDQLLWGAAEPLRCALQRILSAR